MWFLQLAMLVNFALITYQDIKQREVVWFLFPLAMFFMGLLHYRNTEPIPFIINSAINLGVVFGIVGVLYVYATYKLKKSFLKETFGLGDLLFFMAFAFGFPFATFIVVFVFSLLFSLLVAFVIQRKEENNTIPLAGYMAVFLVFVFGLSWILKTPNLYLI